jgi:ABC-type nitrate/sulfonate/bicarbonate transport system substrate-binding protein
VNSGRIGRILAIAVAASFALSAAALAQAPGCGKPDNIRVMYFAAVFNNMLTFVAEDAGFYRKHCLDATLVSVNSGPAGLAQLQSGSLQFSDSSVDNTLIARNKGLPIKIVAGESSGDVYSIVARKGLPLPHAKAGYPAVMQDLVGKKIGVFAVGAGSEYIVRALLRGAGLDPSGVTYVGVGSTPTQLAALQNGAVDAVTMADPGQDLAVALGYGQIAIDLRKPGVGPPDVAALSGQFQVKVAAESLVRGKPDLVKRFVAANRDAERWIQDPANFAALVKLMKAHVPLGKEVPDADALFTRLVKQYVGFASAAVSRSGIAAWNRFEIAAGNLPKPIKFDDLVWSGTPVRK